MYSRHCPGLEIKQSGRGSPSTKAPRHVVRPIHQACAWIPELVYLYRLSLPMQKWNHGCRAREAWCQKESAGEGKVGLVSSLGGPTAPTSHDRVARRPCVLVRAASSIVSKERDI